MHRDYKLFRGKPLQKERVKTSVPQPGFWGLPVYFPNVYFPIHHTPAIIRDNNLQDKDVVPLKTALKMKAFMVIANPISTCPKEVRNILPNKLYNFVTLIDRLSMKE